MMFSEEIKNQMRMAPSKIIIGGYAKDADASLVRQLKEKGFEVEFSAEKVAH